MALGLGGGGEGKGQMHGMWIRLSPGPPGKVELMQNVVASKATVLETQMSWGHFSSG
jgi:hypothetical protein